MSRSAQPARTWIERRTIALALIIVLIASGTPNVVSHVSAREAALDRAVAAALDPRLAPDSGYRSIGTPPSSDEMQLLSGSITPSGANPQYPANHTFDAAPRIVGTPPANHDFEVPGYAVGTPPANSDLQAPAQAIGTPPANHDFATGDLSGWTTTGTVTIASDADHGAFAKLGASGTITSAAFLVDPQTQVLQLEIGRLAQTNSNSWYLYALSGTGYTTSTLLANASCTGCPGWETRTVDVSAYRGQQIKLKLDRSSGEIGIDAPRMAILFPDYTTSGLLSRVEEADGNVYARLDKKAVFTSSAFTVDTAAQFVSIRTIDGGQPGGGQFFMYVLSGADYTQSTRVHINTNVPDVWTRIPFNAGGWRGQSIKLRIERQGYAFGVDDIGTQAVDLPGWSVTKDAWIETGGPSGAYVATNGTLTSSAFTLAPDVQQMTVQASGRTNPLFYIELLRGADFSQVVDLGGGALAPSTTEWTTYRVAVQGYAGETVKLRIRQYFGTGLYDSAGVGEVTIPGWTFTTTKAATTGENEDGTFVAPVPYGGAPINLQSVDLSTGIVDTASGVEQRYYAVSYEIGLNTTTGSTIRVTWFNRATGQSWVVFTDVANTPTGYRTSYFYLADFMGTDGYFVVQVPQSGRLYAIADNIARQALNEPHSESVGMQIDTSTGAFGYQATDLQTFGQMPLIFTRYFNGHSDQYGAMGYRWTHSYDTRLIVTQDGDAGVVLGSGRELFFDWRAPVGTPGRFVPADPRVNETLVKNGDGTYTFTTTTNLAYGFTATGRLESITDRNGNQVTLTYDATNRLNTVTDPVDRALTLAYDPNGRLISVADPIGATWTYGYDQAGDLTTATDPLNQTWTYRYDRHRLVEVIGPDGVTVVENTLDDLNRVTTQTLADGATIGVAYSTPGKGATEVTDPEGNTATYYFDRFARTTHKVDPLGRVLRFLYDARGNRSKVVDPLNNEWVFGYDGSGNLTSFQDATGNPLSISYTPQRLPASITDACGNVSTLTYDTVGNIESVTDALNRLSIFTYDSAGRVLTETNALNQTTIYTYDTQGNRTSMTDALGNVWSWTYDANGRVLTETDANSNTTEYEYNLLGQLVVMRDALDNEITSTYTVYGYLLYQDDQLGNRTRWAYDSRGFVIQKQDRAGKVWSYTYDDTGKMLTETDPLGQTTTYTYDDAGRMLTATNPENETITWTYDAAGRVGTITDALGYTITYGYDAAGRVTSATLPNGGIVTLTYDDCGNLLASTDPLGRVTSYSYDDANQKTAMTDPRGRTTSYGYDLAGRLTTVTDPMQGVVTYGFDPAGRMTSVTDQLSLTTTFTYDPNGNQLTATDPLNQTTTTVYDALNRVVATTDALSRTTSYAYDDTGRQTRLTMPSGSYTDYGYDPRGLLTSVTNRLGHATTYGYDDAGRRTSMTDPNGRTTSYGYDTADRQTTMTDALGGVVTFGYDDAGRVISVTTPRGRTTSYTYNTIGQQLSETDPLGLTRTATYDLAGQLTSASDPRGVAVSYGYDAAGNQTSVSYPGGAITYAYDDLGRRTSMTDPTGTTSWSYDAASRVTGVGAPGGAVSYGYDNAGRRTSITYPGNRTVTYGYDAGDQLTSLTDWESRTIAFTYTADGQRESVTRPNGVTTDYGYDLAGRLTSVTHNGAGLGSQFSYAYTLDAAGNRTAMTSGSGTETYVLDELNRLTNVSYANGDTAAYTYDPNGNRLTETVNGAQTQAYTYDDADRLLSDGTTTYDYDTAGNLTSTGTDSFTWDWNNRLQTATVNGTTSSYAYDGDGVRVETTVGSTVTTNVWDRESGLPLLLDDGTNAYLHAGSVLGQIDASDDASSLMTDALGSVRGTTDEAGAVTGTAEYDVFGRLRTSSGSTGIFGFTGEQTEATGFTHLRARDYDPSTGRLLSADTVQPNAPGTQGYNRYAYVANNPTTWTDPSGHIAVGTAAVLNQQNLAAIGNLVRMATILGAVAAVIPPFFSLALLGLFIKVLIAVLVLFVVISIFITLINDPWEYFPDGSIPSIPPITLDPTRIWDAAQTFPNSPKNCLGGAISGIRDELVWGILAGQTPGALDLGVAAFTSCMSGSGGGGGGSSEPLRDLVKEMSDRELRRFVESLETTASTAGKATRTHDDTRTILDELLKRDWKIENIDLQNTDGWMGGPHLDLLPPSSKGTEFHGVPIHFPVPQGFVP